ncbi:MAG TPA: DNA polymerase III subunit epsilon [Gammaproteobacteria bacterium]|nr:DNA polymerase III subunit epsilon [Gammaproteobacteria bacterium]
MRQVVLDTETTGLEPSEGHRIIEIGCVELVNRRATNRHFHEYVNPQREIEEGALAVHGISQEFLSDKPSFEQIVDRFLEFVRGAEVIIHNAPFDVGFINHELAQLEGDLGELEDYCQVLDSLILARHKHPGQRNSLDALCKRYDVDNAHRTLHGALLDAQILADLYLKMTGGQTSLLLGEKDGSDPTSDPNFIKRVSRDHIPLPVIFATEEELTAHETRLQQIEALTGQPPIWRR